MTAKTVPVETFDLVIFGGTGDLALRKLLPGLFRRYADGQIPEDSRIIGVARDKDSCCERSRSLGRACPGCNTPLSIRLCTARRRRT